MLCLIVQYSAGVENALEAAGRWLLHSGIQSPDGGVARFCDLAGAGNRPVSNEITGYAASAYAFLWELSGEARYLDAAIRTARFLTRTAWRADLGTFPFENLSPVAPAYFFDCGIIVRGLLAVHRITEDEEFLRVAREAGRGMARDFLTPSAIHPIVELPSGRALPYERRWSREPGCFLLKSALVWRQLGAEFEPYFETAIGQALASWESFLPEDPLEEAMNRLHAFSYFLEALLFVKERPGVSEVIRTGLARALRLREAIAPRFARSDVYAQMLRVRVLAGDRFQFGDVVDKDLAAHEFDQVMSFRDLRPDPRAEGGFYFGRRDGLPMPFANPVSTVFCLQALAMYEGVRAGARRPWLESLY